MDKNLLEHPIWKCEDSEPEIANEGEFLVRYMLSTISGKTLYLGRCECGTARRLNTPIISFADEVNCYFCEKPVKLAPVPRIHEDRWIFGSPQTPVT
jgi:hypothetical protein